MKNLTGRFVVCALASLSFAALFFEFYGWGRMQTFALGTFFPAIIALIFLARSSTRLKKIILDGAIGGIFAALVYDIFRVPFVMAGYPLFAVFPKFGQMLLRIPLNAAPQNVPLEAHFVGWIYHFINGASLGIMFCAMCVSNRKTVIFWSAVAWALVVEILLLLSPYYTFFKLKMDHGTFLILTLSAHAVFGVALGWWLSRRTSSTRFNV